MEGNISRVVRLGAGLLGVVTLGWILAGQAAQPVPEGLPTDWTYRHVIFSQPATAEEAGRMAGDPRYWQQWYRQNVVRVLSFGVAASADATPWGIGHTSLRADSQIRPDWSQTLGADGTVGAGNFPAKYSFGITTANCASAANPDFVVFSTGLTGSGTQASIVAFDNLYSGCTSPPSVPNVYWAYNTSGEIRTSPVFSRDGSQIAFVQTNGTAANLVLLRWATGGTVGNPAAPTLFLAPSSYFGCTAPCMITIPLEGGTGAATNDTTSSVFYDYISDTAWVGDASGWLHQFNPVFTAAPAEIRTSPWPVHVSTATNPALSSPVYDGVSGNVFLSDQSGYLYSVVASGTSAGTITKSAQLDFGPSTAALASGPVLDKTAEKVYAFASSDGSTNCAGAACSAVYQFSATFTGGTSGTKATVGTSSATANPLYDGAFDNEFYSSPTRTGSLYVCGDTGVDPILYRMPMTAGTFGTAVSVAPLTPVADHRACSPVTDVLNPNGTVGPQERAFFSVTQNGHPTGCGAGCAMSFITTPWQAGTADNVGQEILTFAGAPSVAYINVAIGAGTSGTTVPAWSATIGSTITDGTVTWLNQGPTEVTAMAGWELDHRYTVNTRIFDGANVEIVTVPGISGGAAPPWATTAGGATTGDGTVSWINAGPLANAALAATGGTSGIIIDNTVSTGTLAGTSELYFSTLGNEDCPTTPTSGCAVQASQSALK